MLRNTLLATYQSTYEINGTDISDSRNARTAGGSFAIPWRATLSTGWVLGNNAFQSLVRFTDGYVNDQTPNAGTLARPEVGKYMAWDLSYSYDFGDRFGIKSSQVSIGVNNVTDNSAPYVPDGNHTLSSIYDYSGRHWWLRLKASF
jgi:hypothetical protein